MSKAFTSILIILSILFIHSAKLNRDIHTGEPVKESSMGREGKSTSVSESDFIEERRGNKSFTFEDLEKFVTPVSKTSKTSQEKNKEDIKLEKTLKVLQEETEEEKREQRMNNNRFTEDLDDDYVSLSYRDYIADNIDELAEAIKDNRIVETLCLYNDQIGDKEVKAISEALKVNKSITQFELSGNQIGYRGAEYLSDALKVNESITTFYLDQNEIGDRGAKAISEALKVNKSITFISLEVNQIGDKGVEYLIEALKVNKNVTIHLEDDLISPSTLKKFEKLNKKIKNITSYFYYN